MALDVVCKRDRDGVIDEQKKSIVKQAMRITSLKQKIDTAELPSDAWSVSYRRCMITSVTWKISWLSKKAS